MTPSARSTTSAARLIAIDWGTTAMRAYLLADEGVVLDSRTESWGIMQLADGDFESAFRRMVGDWLSDAPDLCALASGMIGSAQGWIEAPYRPSPAGVDELAASIVRVGDGPLSIVPGVLQRGDAPNVMRGEETQIIGALEANPALGASSLLVLPGTHSKWVHVHDGRIREFITFMTGELFAVLSASSILGRFARDAARPPEPAAAARAFARGVEAARGAGVGISPLLFSARSLVLAGALEPECSLEYLSGLLIGDELRCGLAVGARPSALLGDADLCARYGTAFAVLGVEGVPVVGGTAPAGLWAIARRAGLVGPTRPEAVA